MNKYYPHLFEPLRIKNLIYKNRIEASPMGVIPTHHFISAFDDYGGISFDDKAKGDVGALHIVSHGVNHEHGYISNGADPFYKYQLDITQEQMSVGKQKGAVTSICLGVITNIDGILMGPSEANWNNKQITALPIEKIEYIIDDLAKKAKTAKAFGLDAILLDIAHDSLIAQFMAPFYNQRSDKYGGSRINRFRFGKELIERVRKAVGEEFVIELRISATLHIEGSYEFDEMLEFLKDIEDNIDIVNVSSGMDEIIEANVHAVSMLYQPHMKNAEFAEKIKKLCHVYVSVGGAIMTPEEAEMIIAEQKADFVMLGRSLLADPYWVSKAKTGRSEDIVPCLRCNYCYHISTQHFQTVCSVNPRLYREKRVPLVLKKIQTPKKVAIIGGGPAGCKAALVAIEKGHYVDLYEKEDKLGGQLNVADFGGNHKIDLKRYKDYLVTQVLKSDINIFYNSSVSKEALKAKNYDVLIVAIGATPIIPSIQGVNNDKVLTSLKAFENIKSLGHKIVIIGGGSIGVELGIQLAELGKCVHIIEKSDQLACSSNLLYKAAMKNALTKTKELTVCLNTSVVEIQEKSIIANDENNQCCHFDFDNVVLAVGMSSKQDEAYEYYNIAEETYVIGDCKKVAKVLEATNDAYFIAANL